MEIVDYLSRAPLAESELNQRFVVATINSFHEALYLMSSRLESTGSLNRNGNVLEHSRRNVAKQSSLSGCYGNQNGHRNEKKTSFATVQTAKQQLNGNEKKTTFATVQTAKQQLTKKTDHFFFN